MTEPTNNHITTTINNNTITANVNLGLLKTLLKQPVTDADWTQTAPLASLQISGRSELIQPDYTHAEVKAAPVKKAESSDGMDQARAYVKYLESYIPLKCKHCELCAGAYSEKCPLS